MSAFCSPRKRWFIFHFFGRHLRVQDIEDCVIPFGTTAWDLCRFQTKIIQSKCQYHYQFWLMFDVDKFHSTPFFFFFVEGDIATAIRASCCFPLLFAPVMIDGSPHIDGGVFDDGGLFALPGVPPSNLVVNVVCGRTRLGSSILPDRFKDARVRYMPLNNCGNRFRSSSPYSGLFLQLLTIVLDNIPSVQPFDMAETGPLAYRWDGIQHLHTS